jgi:hypothetical protein
MSNPTAPNAWTELHGAVRAFVGRRVHDTHAADDVARDVIPKVQAYLFSARSVYQVKGAKS